MSAFIIVGPSLCKMLRIITTERAQVQLIMGTSGTNRGWIYSGVTFQRKRKKTIIYVYQINLFSYEQKTISLTIASTPYYT